ncbi:prepilin-type N-terminal cleavage/methylation domain-containing protein [Stanieria cyanosphaera PCC 7437]|uniref:Prepilin-type N-terminal cleavage/methylation domain-containing protein n=1 Tax=Stanieria cyanosphaera (strain ATCC 29371 / PCC 7437) TaxID=111780 RepID=K9XW04_STAC7|nr:hypothetical protein [Stanieria cyanosphaera]AFZ36249.1 prepilin-type N-terminal cleavage/methylation domain-containing protein [Stanieria cyanosphaera PCC 7437]
MHVNLPIKLKNKHKKSTGYTLPEILLGASISFVVIGAAGWGLINMLQGNKTSSAQAGSRTEVNRALEFISDEVKKAEAIETNPTTNVPAGLTIPTSGQAILALDLPNMGQANTDNRVIYYVRSKPDDKWLGPKVIYRYGPPLDNNGNYTNGTWVNQPLVDRVDDQTITPSPCTGTAISGTGFAACVNNNKKTAQVYLSGVFGDSDEQYQANTQVYARAQAENLTGASSNNSFGSLTTNPLNPGGTSKTYKVRNLASAMGCNPAGDPCNMTIKFRQTSTGNPEITTTPDTNGNLVFTTSEEFYIEVTPSTTLSDKFLPEQQNNSNPVLSNDSTRVLTLGDGSNAPSNTAWNPTANPNRYQNIGNILQTNNYIQNNKITLPKNQYIIAFEIGQTDTTHPGFDWQDQVLVVTVE